ncbi:MAG: hypothetical protein KDK36_12565 [Leptospiraceae bacterium]|nr:hypothetical protein [Leptospiraceae bacterium]
MPGYDDDFDDEYNDEDEDDMEEEDDGSILLACEDCDYRWKVEEDDSDYGDYESICPMCGSSNIVEI